tara:strand:+ start:2708 stop:4333 length:1626 start_codon:yes stop_codon:yes gene_type:complete
MIKEHNLSGLDPVYHQTFKEIDIEDRSITSYILSHEKLQFLIDRSSNESEKNYYKVKRDQSVSEKWNGPLAIKERTDLPEFPTEVLPLWMKEWVKCCAETYQVQPDLPAIVALGLFAGSISRRVQVNPTPGRYEEVNLYQMVILPPGEGKSPVFSEAKIPLSKTEQALVEFMRPEIAKKIAETRATEEQLKHQEKCLARETDANQKTVILAEVVKMRDKLLEIGEIGEPRLYCDDTTPERLVTLMASNNGRMTLPSSESDGLLTAIGRYSDSPNLGVLLKAWSGEECRVDRATSDSTIIQRPSLNILITVQPKAAEDLLKIDGFKGRGLADRFLYSIPKTMSGQRITRPKAIPEKVKTQYEGYMSASWSLFDSGSTQTLTLTKDALETWYKFVDWLEPKLAPDGELSPISGWANKLKSYALRFASVINLASSSAANNQIRKEDMEGSVKICKYYLEHTYDLLSEKREDKTIKLAMKLSAWIKKNKSTEFTTDQIVKEFSHVEDYTDIETALDILKTHHQIRKESYDKWKVNPLLLALHHSV